MKSPKEPIKQKKSLSQVFLQEDWPCRKISAQIAQMGVQSVLEIGPGNGILTRTLLDEGLKVTAVERDPRFAERLPDILSPFYKGGQLQVIQGDILTFDLKSWLDKTPGIKAICGNIPYHISSPIVQLVLPLLSQVRSAVFLVQQEFGERLASLPNHKSYGSLSVFCQLRSKVKVEFLVPRNCFHPVPKVDSAVVSLLDRLHDKIDPELLRQVEKITRQVFTQRRKKLSNSLSPFLKDVNLERFPIDLNRRCDSLSPQEFLEIAIFLR